VCLPLILPKIHKKIDNNELNINPLLTLLL
jgi:hypothetical protein